MAYVNVPNDLSKIKNKLMFNLTKRQLICFGIAAAIGIPVYLFSRNVIGNMGAMLLMIIIMLPCFLFAMYERDGLPFEKILRNVARTVFIWSRVRPYKTENFYAYLNAREEINKLESNKKQKTRAKTKKKARR